MLQNLLIQNRKFEQNFSIKKKNLDFVSKEYKLTGDGT